MIQHVYKHKEENDGVASGKYWAAGGTDIFPWLSLCTSQVLYHMRALSYTKHHRTWFMLNKCLHLTIKISILLKIFLGAPKIPNDNSLQPKIPGEIYIQIHIMCVTLRMFLDFLIKTGPQQEKQWTFGKSNSHNTSLSMSLNRMESHRSSLLSSF